MIGLIEKYNRDKHKKQTKSQSNLNETSEPQTSEPQTSEPQTNANALSLSTETKQDKRDVFEHRNCCRLCRDYGRTFQGVSG